MAEFSIVMEGKIGKTNQRNSKILLAINARTKFFDSISYELCGREIDSVRDPGRLSTIRRYISYKSISSQDLAVAGWNYPGYPIVNDNSLCLITLSIFNDYYMVLCRKKMEW